RGPGGGTDGRVRRWYLRAIGLLPAESVGDGGADGRLIGELAAWCGGPARDRAGDGHRADFGNPARLRVQSDGGRGAGIYGSVQGLNCAQNVHKTDPCLCTKCKREFSEEGSTMGVLRKKDERTDTITVRVPSSIKAELDQLRERADVAGFDLNATMTES